MDNSTVFWNRPWVDYKNGFNNGLNKNFWLGLDRINVLTKKDTSINLRIDLFGNRCPASGHSCDPNFGPDVYFYGEWGSFSVRKNYFENFVVSHSATFQFTIVTAKLLRYYSGRRSLEK